METMTMGLRGLDAVLVPIKVELSREWTVAGLKETQAAELRVRVKAALRNVGIDPPPHAITVKAPPGVNVGAGADLAVARTIMGNPTDPGVLVGELTLDGRVQPVIGVYQMAREAERLGLTFGCPLVNEGELPPGSRARVFSTLVGFEPAVGHSPPEPQRDAPDMADCVLTPEVRSALEAALIAGGGILFIGAPGAGKTMLARRIPGLLPPMTDGEKDQANRIYSAAGLLRRGGTVEARPFRAPHSTCSHAAMIGGGSPPRAGEASLAHNGVLFLDELPEFNRTTLEALAMVHRDGYAAVSRGGLLVAFPAHFLLVGAMNPCPCGHSGSRSVDCRCTTDQVARYRARIDFIRPLFPHVIELPPVDYGQLRRRDKGESSAAIQARIIAARAPRVWTEEDDARR